MNCASDLPLISVIIPAYNAEAYIAKTLRSVLAQTYRNIEVLIVDDGSSDRTHEISQSFSEIDSRVTLIQQSNQGVAAARNKGIQMARGQFIAPIDADDLWGPENLERQLHYMIQGGSSVGLVYAWSVDIDESDAPIGSFRAAKIQGQVYATLVCHNFIGNASAMLMRRSCIEQVGGYNQTLRSRQAQGCEDWDLSLRIAAKYEFRVVPEFLIAYRKQTVSMSCDYDQMARSHILVMQTVRQQQLELPTFLFRLSSSNLYGYFAHQSHRCQDHSMTLYWLAKTVQADPITPWFRLGLYLLLIQSLFKIKQLLSVANPPQSIADLHQRRNAIALKLIVGNLFHWVISRLAYRSTLKRTVTNALPN